jgi:hypothetical protein
MAYEASNLKTECMSVRQLRNLQKVAELCNALTMPPALHNAHQKLDTVVATADQPSGGKKIYATDPERDAFLFDLYQRITSLLSAAAAKKKHKTNTTESRLPCLES